MIRVAKCYYLFSLIAATDCHLAALFKATQSRFRKKDLDDHLQGHAEEFVGHLTVKIRKMVH